MFGQYANYHLMLTKTCHQSSMMIEIEVHSHMVTISNFSDWMMNKSDLSTLDGVQK
jgi:hypothetical protein